LIRLMTGREVKELYPRNDRAPGPPVLAAAEASTGHRLRRVSLRLRQGEIFGLAGLIGAGRTELLRALFGLDRLEQGEVVVLGSPARRLNPRWAWRNGLGFLSENRKEEGPMLNQSLADNLTLPKLSAFGRGGWIDRRRQEEAGRKWIAALDVRCRGPAQQMADLSGGNQQKIALARLLEHPARIFLLDEPTRGIDVGSKAQIYRLIAEIAAAGKSVLIASSYLPELLGLCDTIGVMCRGRLAAVRPRAEWSEEEIMRAATGAV